MTLRKPGEEEQKGHENPIIPGGQGPLTGKELDDVEKHPREAKQGAIGALEEGLVKGGLSSLGGPVSGGFSVINSLFSKRKKTFTGLVVGLVIGFSGILGFGIIQGPMQLMHLAQILQIPFSDQEQASENRLSKLLRFTRSGDFGDTRVSMLGNRSAKKTFARLEKEAGIKIVEKTGAGRPSVVEIDTSKYAPGATTQEAAISYAKTHGIPTDQIRMDTTVSDQRGGTFRVGESGRALSDSASRSIFREGIGKLYGKLAGPILTAVKGRAVFAKNGNFSKLRVWKRLNTHALEKAIEADKQRKARKAERTPRAEERLSKLKGKIRPVAGVAAAASALQLGGCVAMDIAHETPLATYENVVAPAENQALEFISGDSQLRAGDNFRITQPGAMVKNLNDKDGSAWQSQALNAMTDQDSGSGKQVPDDYRGSFSSNSPEVEVEKALDKVGGKFICGTVGQIVGGIIGIGALVLAAPTGGASIAVYAGAAAGSTLAVAAGSYFLTKAVVSVLADEPIYKDPQGTNLGHTLAYGSQALAADMYRKSGAAPIEGQSTTSAPLLAQNKEDFQQKSFFARTFDIYDYRSVASKAIDSSNFNASQTIASLTNSFGSLGSVFSNIFSLFSPRLLAADGEGAYDFGFPRYGFTQADLDNPLTEDPYKNAEKAASILKSNDDYVDRAKDCFGVEFDEDNGWKVDLINNPDGDPEKDVLPNTAKYQEANCGDRSNKWLIIRLFIFDSRTMEAYACYEGVDENACIQPEVAPTASGDTEPPEEPETADCEIDFSVAPNLEDLAKFIDQECENNLPIIENLMGRPSPFADPHKIKIVEARDMAQSENGAALGQVFTGPDQGGEVGLMLLNKDYLRQNTNNKKEVRGLLVHELTHIAQGYSTEPGSEKLADMFGELAGDGTYQFVTEGGADYIRATFPGTGSREQHLNCLSPGWRVYTAGYRCGSALLAYIHDSYSKDAIKKLNEAIRAGEYSDSFFSDLTGKDLNTLFNECIRNPRQQPLCRGGTRQ